MTTYHSLKVFYIFPSSFLLFKHQISALLLGEEQYCLYCPVIFLWSMSRSHEFVLENYKNSWNDGPPWPVCKYCDSYNQCDGSAAPRLKQSDLIGSPSLQRPDLLSPEALEFYPRAYQSSNSSSGQRLYRSLPSRRYQGPFAPSRPIQHPCYRGARPFRSTTHCFIPAGIFEPKIFDPGFRHAPITGYDSNRIPEGRIKANLWHTLPTKGRMRQAKTQDIYQYTALVDTVKRDKITRSLNSAYECQLSFPGTSIMRAKGNEFVSQNWRIVQPANPRP